MVLSILRIVAFSTTFLFALVVLGLTAHFTSTTNTYLLLTYDFAALAIATSAITFVSIPVMVIVDLMRTGAFTSMVVVELIWLFLIWVLWLSTAADAAWFFSVAFKNSCGYIDQIVNTACHEVQAIQAFGFLTWIILMGYSITLLTYAIIGSTRGHKTWTSSVKQGNFLAPAAQIDTVQPKYPQEPPAMPPVQQYPLPDSFPNGYPSPGTPSQGYPPPGTPSQGYPTPSPPPGTQYQGTQGVPSPQGHAYV